MRTAIWVLAILVTALAGFLAYQAWWPKGPATIVVQSDPPGAQVWVDLKPTSVTTNGSVRVPDGRHSVMVRLDTLQSDPVAAVIELRAGSRDTVKFLMLTPSFDRARSFTAAPSAPVAQRTPPQETTQQSDTIILPTSSELRHSAEQADTLWRSSRSSTRKEPEPDATPGVLEISSSLLGSDIFVNDQKLADSTPATIHLPAGVYSIRVTREGYRSDPPEQTIRVSGASLPQLIFFTLKETVAAAGKLTIQTSPVSGKIFVDSIQVGEGTASSAQSFGMHTVSFGDVPGYRRPEPVPVSLSPSRPTFEVSGTYTRAFRVAVEGSQPGQAINDGPIRWQVGAYFEGEGTQASATLGPRIKQIPGTSKFGWELAEGDAARNPTGGDYVEFIFSLPADLPPSTPLNLRLYVYRSGQLYPFTLSGRTEMVVTVNGRNFLDGFRPTRTIQAADEERFEEWSLQGTLRAGENRLLIRNGDRNTTVNFLWKIEIL
jgi:hypothetical protein